MKDEFRRDKQRFREVLPLRGNDPYRFYEGEDFSDLNSMLEQLRRAIPITNKSDVPKRDENERKT